VAKIKIEFFCGALQNATKDDFLVTLCKVPLKIVP
jgi:hypothetical protein